MGERDTRRLCGVVGMKVKMAEGPPWKMAYHLKLRGKPNPVQQEQQLKGAARRKGRNFLMTSEQYYCMDVVIVRELFVSW